MTQGLQTAGQQAYFPLIRAQGLPQQIIHGFAHNNTDTRTTITLYAINSQLHDHQQTSSQSETKQPTHQQIDFNIVHSAILKHNEFNSRSHPLAHHSHLRHHIHQNSLSYKKTKQPPSPLYKTQTFSALPILIPILRINSRNNNSAILCHTFD